MKKVVFISFMVAFLIATLVSNAQQDQTKDPKVQPEVYYAQLLEYQVPQKVDLKFRGEKKPISMNQYAARRISIYKSDTIYDADPILIYVPAENQYFQFLLRPFFIEVVYVKRVKGVWTKAEDPKDKKAFPIVYSFGQKGQWKRNPTMEKLPCYQQPAGENNPQGQRAPAGAR